MSDPIVVVGGGLAAGSAVTELREGGYDGDIELFADEHHVPYERPPLSKAVLRGEKPAESAYVQPASWYAEHDVVVRTGAHVDSVDPTAQTVSTDGRETKFSSLLLATGARVRTLPIEPTDQVEVHYLRNIDDSAALHARLGPDRHLLVVGAGWIGMEAAASARELGTTVTVVDPAEQPLLAVLGPEIGARFAAVHRDHGVDLRTRTALDHLEGGEAILTDGSTIPVDTVLVGVGVVPNDDLASEAGLRVDNGVLVDSRLRTDHPRIFAAGDVANALHPLLGERVRVEHWQNAIGQGKTAAHAILGEPVSYADLPYFFTDQYDLGMEYFGYIGSGGFDDLTVEPGKTDDAFAAYWSREGRLVAAMHVNQWDRSDELRDRVRDSH
jgi:3-phenylpropionate/trans-cinnamate dioxygenase ferredoxin reductase component